MTAAPALTVPPVRLPAEQTIPDLRAIIEDAITNTPRSLQTALGPSEIGCACDRCLIRMIAGQKGNELVVPWLPTIGTAVHEWLEGVVLRHLLATGSDRYLPEGKVTVGDVDGVPVTGHSDVFDTHTGTVIDFKIVGKATLDKVRRAKACSGTYRAQKHLYGRGWARAGFDVRSVAIWYMPRNAVSLAHGQVVQEPYDEQVAVAALDRATRFTQWIKAFGVDTVLAGAPSHTGEEFSCAKWPDSPTRAPRNPGDPFAG